MYIRADHLQAMINYCLLHTRYGIETLAFDNYNNQQGLDVDEMVTVLEYYQLQSKQFEGYELKITPVSDCPNCG